MNEKGGKNPQPLKRVQAQFWSRSHRLPPTAATWSQVPARECISLGEGRSGVPREQIQITETSEQPLCAHTKLLLLIQHGMLQILYSVNIYSLQKWLPNH